MSWGREQSGISSGFTPGATLWFLGGIPFFVAPMLRADPAMAQTRAGTVVSNVADARYRIGDATAAVRSNVATIRIAERLDVTLARVGDPSVADGVRIVPVRIANTGNGTEAFAVTATLPAGTVRGLRYDASGHYDPATEIEPADGHTVPLGPGAAITAFVLIDAAATGPLIVRAIAATGSGRPGTVFADAGDGGGDAVVGSTGAAATLTIAFDAEPAPTLVKSQTVLAPDGSTNPVRGAVVTYTIDAAFAGPADAATLDDPIPAGTRYVAGSLRLDDAVLSDADDADPGRVADGGVRVAFGRIAAAATHRIRFQVQLQ